MPSPSPSPSPSPNDNPRLNAVIAEIMKREDAGQRVDQQAMLEAYPDLADPLQSYFQAKAMMAGFAVAETVLPKAKVSPLPTNVRETIRPGAVASDTASEFHSRSFGRYQLLRPLGEGAMGSVFLAQDSSLDRQVALKIPKTDGKNMHEFVTRFAREAKAAAGLKHPNICSVFDAGEHEGMPYITMEYIDGVPLSRFIGSSQLRSVDSVLQMVATIAEAVGHAHSKGVIHRDLKPGNILVDAEFRPIVTDFGLARRAGADNESRITQEGMLIGTPAYMAPEQVKGEQAKVGPRSDIYSLGVMLFEMLTLRLPFEAVDGNVPEMVAKILRDHPPFPGKFRKDLSEDVDDLCGKMLKKDPDKRFNSMPDVVTAIGQLREKLKRAPVSATDVARQQSPFEIQKAHIEQMLKKGQYAAAIQDLEKLAKETLPGAKAVAEWARKTLPDVRSEAKSLNPAGLAALLRTAREMFEKHDYPGCIQLLDDIPSLRRTEAIEDLLEKAHARETEAEQLLSDIKDRERTQNLDGIEVLLKRLLKLKPGNSYAKRLWEALQSYSKTSATRRQYRFEKGRLQPMPELGFLKQWAMLGSLVGGLVFFAVYAYVIFYIKSDTQTLAVHVNDDWLKEQGGELTLLVDGKSHTISTSSPNSEALNVTVTFGDHTFSVKNGDSIVHDPESFTIQRDSRQILSITSTDIELVANLPVPPPLTPEPTPSRFVYLDDLQETKFDDGWGSVLGKHGYSAGGRLECPRLTGEKVSHSLFPQPKENGYSVIEYQLNGACTAFKSTVHNGSDRNLTFEVLGDGKSLWKSQESSKLGYREAVEITVTGVQVLELRTHCRGSFYAAWCWWIEPRLTVVPGKESLLAHATKPKPDPISVPPVVPLPRSPELVETTTVPNKSGKLEKDLPEPEAVLVGFDVTEGIVKVGFDAKVITSIKPLYRNNQGVLQESAKTYGVQNGAKKRLGDIPSYAVSAVRVKGAENFYVDSIEVTFKPIDRFTDPLNPSDVITAKAGGSGGSSCPILGQNGKQSVGLLVRSSESGITGLGLIQSESIVTSVVLPTPPGETALSFDGDDWIEIPRSANGYNGKRPLTIEAIVRPQADTHQTVIGNFQKAGFGLEILDSKWAFAFHDETTYQFAKSNQPAEIGKKVHVAAVFDGRTTILFVDGKRQSTVGQIKGSHRASTYPFWIGADPNSERKPEKLWRGLIYSIRVSDTVRYTTDFPQPQELTVDRNSVAVYDMSKSVHGEVLRDLSGNGWDGIIRGAKLLTAALPPKP